MTERLAITLPEPIAAYFAADKLDRDAVGRCFTKDAVVKDEGRTYTGLVAIKQWKTETSAKYTYTCEPFRFDRTGDASVVTCHLEGSNSCNRKPNSIRYSSAPNSGRKV